MIYVFSLTREAEGQMREEKRRGDRNYKQQELDTSSRAADYAPLPNRPAAVPTPFSEPPDIQRRTKQESPTGSRQTD